MSNAPRTAARVAQHEWTGRDGLGRLQARMPCSSRTPRAFRARAKGAELAGLRLVEWESNDLWTRGPIAHRGDELELAVVLAGRIRLDSSSGSWWIGPGEVGLVHPDEVLRWACPDGVHLRMVRIPEGLAPARLRDRVLAPSGVLQPTRLVDVFGVALARGVGAAFEEDVTTDYLGEGLRGLALAVLEELAASRSVDRIDPRAEITSFIDRNLRDPELGPRSIARSFGMSPRWVHSVFGGSGITVAQLIRARRADAVAEQLRSRPGRTPVSALAASFGFSGREQLARTFRWRWGRTLSDYQRAVLLGEAPRPVPGTGGARAVAG